ncbi:MAG: adenylate/guanylate cyclase domain-containing protein [Alphaproteobacteria bacterium]|nr:adenylate/guanylate cyclase domain-containing protein [Alphaproteobacteria bacterium]
MFTDIVGFTSVSEHLTAPETAQLLNDHFALLVAAVEAEGGTVDKFVGDGMLAFWRAGRARRSRPGRDPRLPLHFTEGEAGKRASRRGWRQADPAAYRHPQRSGGRRQRRGARSLELYGRGRRGKPVRAPADPWPGRGARCGGGDSASEETVSRIGPVGAASLGAYQLRGRSGAVTVWRIDETAAPDAVAEPAPIGLAGE